MEFLTANERVGGNTSSYHFDKAGSQATAALAPLLLEIRSPEKGFLRACLRCRKGGVEIRTRERFLFLRPYAKKHGKATDESIPGASSIHGLHLERGDEFHLLWSRHQAAALSQRDDHSAHPLLEQKLGALFCLIGGSNRHPTDDFGLALIWNEIICVADFLEVNWLSRSGIHDAANTVCFRKPHGVVNATQGK